MPVPDFSPGEVLTAAAMDSIGLWKVTTVSFSAITAAAPVNAVGCFTDKYLNYMVKINTTSGTANSELGLQLLSGTTPATGSDYRFAGTGSNSASAASNFGSATANNFAVTYNTSNSTVGAQIDIYQPKTARRTTIYTDFLYDDGGTLIGRRIAGQHNLANSYDGFRIFPATGNVTGSLTVYGYRD